MYQGEDLIIATGAPGCRWSGSVRAIQSHVDINTTDENDSRIYGKPGKRPNDLGWHRGAYWGPGHEFGNSFDRMDLLSKDQILAEFQAPFADWHPGIKIIKSHWFSYHLPQLREMFPRARMIGFWMPDDFCFEWWHKVGGWKITYPHYDWYQNDQRMLAQIAIENQNIQDFFSLDQLSLDDIYAKLGMESKLHTEEFLLSRDKKLSDLTASRNESAMQVLNQTVFRTFTGVL
jgi:hypothetical protein